jgi:hypothetical protein
MFVFVAVFVFVAAFVFVAVFIFIAVARSFINWSVALVWYCLQYSD